MNYRALKQNIEIMTREFVVGDLVIRTGVRSRAYDRTIGKGAKGIINHIGDEVLTVKWDSGGILAYTVESAKDYLLFGNIRKNS